MSKFIRTKDGIIYVGDLVKDEQGNYCDPKDYETIEVSAEHIIKEADTIEELIDGYIFVSKSGETHYVYFKDYDMGVCLGCRIERDEEFKNHLLENGCVYGAIWTSKGLIYVAKMNDKGELELI